MKRCDRRRWRVENEKREREERNRASDRLCIITRQFTVLNACTWHASDSLRTKSRHSKHTQIITSLVIAHAHTHTHPITHKTPTGKAFIDPVAHHQERKQQTWKIPLFIPHITPFGHFGFRSPASHESINWQPILVRDDWDKARLAFLSWAGKKERKRNDRRNQTALLMNGPPSVCTTGRCPFEVHGECHPHPVGQNRRGHTQTQHSCTPGYYTSQSSWGFSRRTDSDGTCLPSSSSCAIPSTV